MANLCLLLSIFSLSIYGQTPEYGITCQSVINLRSSPGFATEMGTQALMGTPVHILETVHGWSNVITPEGYTAWTTEESVQKMSAGEYKAWNAASKVIVTSYFSVLRSLPSETSEVVSDVVWGDVVGYTGKRGKYFSVVLPDGRTAYLLKASSMPFDEWLPKHQPTAANIIATAKHFIGFPYLWGGTSIKGMDCSGFSKTCFFLNGVILPRDASQQALTGENVDISKDLNLLQPADLLFFGSIKEGIEHVTHVAIYTGNGEFIHSSGRVRTGSLLPGSVHYDAYNASRLLRSQRLLTRIDQDTSIVSIKKHPFYQ